jgi:hypothetical protein
LIPIAGRVAAELIELSRVEHQSLRVGDILPEAKSQLLMMAVQEQPDDGGIMLTQRAAKKRSRCRIILRLLMRVLLLLLGTASHRRGERREVQRLISRQRGRASCILPTTATTIRDTRSVDCVRGALTVGVCDPYVAAVAILLQGMEDLMVRRGR